MSMVIDRAESPGKTPPIDPRSESVHRRITPVDLVSLRPAISAASPRSSSPIRAATSSSSRGWGPSGGPSRNSTPGMPPRQLVPGRRQVAQQVDARREEIRDHQDTRRPPVHAPRSPRRRCRARPARGSTPRRSDTAPPPRTAPPSRAGRRWPAGAGCRGRSGGRRLVRYWFCSIVAHVSTGDSGILGRMSRRQGLFDLAQLRRLRPSSRPAIVDTPSRHPRPP